MRRSWSVLVGHLLTVVVVALVSSEAYAEYTTADVVVIVDTSGSMKRPGMDPERASLLVTKLLADLVPGRLAAVRTLDLVADRELLPSRPTGRQEPCPEDPSKLCDIVEQATDWAEEARRGGFGVIERRARGDAEFKQQLEGHLEQRSNNSPFHMAFAASRGVFERHLEQGFDAPRTVIWLSDGQTDGPVELSAQVEALRGMAGLEAIVFGQGDPSLPRELGLRVHRSSGPAELMRAFADAFRRIVGAPYTIDDLVSTSPQFEIKQHVEEAWVVVYGDASLTGATVTGPGGTVAADYAADSWPTAGAYRVAYLAEPEAGPWSVSAQGGGQRAAYAVIQRSSLAPRLLEPRTAAVGAPVALVAGVEIGGAGELLTDASLLGELRITALVDGASVELRDDGGGADEQAGDGRFTAEHAFQTMGKSRVELRLQGEIVDRTTRAAVDVTGVFRYDGGPVEIDLGRLGVGATVCRPLELRAEQRGTLPFVLEAERETPRGHALAVAVAGGRLAPAGDPRPLAPGDPLELCLETSPRVASSRAQGEHWLTLRVQDSRGPEQAVPLHLTWIVDGLGFWARWFWLILGILLLLLATFVVLGFVLPHRFPRGLALVFVPEREEVDDQSPQPLRQWRGVGIGFYRSARAFLHPDFRISGRPGGLAGLFAERGGVRVAPGKGGALWREDLEGGWDQVAADGRRARGGDVYRVGEQGPYFRISTRER